MLIPPAVGRGPLKWAVDKTRLDLIPPGHLLIWERAPEQLMLPEGMFSLNVG